MTKQATAEATVPTAPQITQECIDRTIPIELSRAGYNAYYHHCDVYHGRSSYAVCQHTIDAVLDRKMQLRSECQGAIENGTCPALKMRAQEREAGKALFFEDRRERLKELDEKIKQGSNVVQFRKNSGAGAPLQTRHVPNEEVAAFEKRLRNQSTAPAPKKDEGPINADLVNHNVLGDAINNLMKEQK